MNDQQTKERLKAVLDGTSPDSKTSEHPLLMPAQMNPDRALQVLTLAQRTAEEHIASANRQADKIRRDAQAAADQIARDAQVHVHNVRNEADKVLADARATSEKAASDARARDEEALRAAEQIVQEARSQAEKITTAAQGEAAQLKRQAELRFEDEVGSLHAKRTALQQQIEALEEFDRDYRARLTTFMQAQLRALWVDQPGVGDELGPAAAGKADEPEARPAADSTGAVRKK
jgi:cell division septum initiation protein DivIVA